MADEGVTMESLGSKPLVGFTLDATHLFNILAALTKSVDKTNTNVTSLGKRITALEQATQYSQQNLESLTQRLQRVERDGGPLDEIRALKQQLSDLRSLMERHDQEIPELARRTSETAMALNQTNRAVDQIHKDYTKEFDTSRQLQKQQGDQIRVFQQQVLDRGLEGDRIKQQILAQVDQSQKDIALRVDHSIEEAQRRLLSVVDELNKKTLENFRTTDIDIRKFEDSLNALINELANVRADVNTVDNDARHNVTKLRDDNDLKFQEMLAALQSIEQGSAVMERALAEAGRVLHQRGAARSGTSQIQGNSASYF